MKKINVWFITITYLATIKSINDFHIWYDYKKSLKDNFIIKK
jgi:hypothetical protein